MADNKQHQSEIDILKRRGLSPAPERTQPSPPEAKALGVHYCRLLEEFDHALIRIRSYRGQAASPDVGYSTQQLIDAAVRLAAQVRDAAAALASFPRTFVSVAQGVAYFDDIAALADEAYQNGLSELEELETTIGTSYPSSRMIKGTLLSHEGFKGGHLLRKHVGWTMEQFTDRFLEEGKTALSSFIDRGIAEEVVSRAIELHRWRIDQAPEGQRIRIPIQETKDIGYIKTRDGEPRLTKVGHIYIFKDSSHPSGYRITSAELGEAGGT